MRRRIVNGVLTAICGTAALLSAAAFILILGVILFRGLPALNWSFFASDMRAAGAEGGIVYQIFGTVILVLTAAAVAVPLAAGVGIWLHAYCAERWRHFFEPALHALNGVPSIVFGLVGFAFFFNFLGLKKSWLAGGLLLALMILPTLVVAFLERLRAIPQSTILAAVGLGLPRGDVVRTVLFPQGVSGLLTGTLLGLARAAGETAPIMFTAAIFAGATMPNGIVDSPVLALPYHIFVLAQDSFNPEMRQNLWGTAAVLVTLVTCLSAIAIPLRLRISKEGRRD